MWSKASKETGGDNNTKAQTWKVRQGEIRHAKHWKPRLYQQVTTRLNFFFAVPTPLEL